MSLASLLEQIRPIGLDGIAFPSHLLGAFRRKSISFCSGLTDEMTIVYWFQSRGFTIDLRLPDGAATGVTERQGWIGDTLWDDATGRLSWDIARSYQPRNQWPEPAELRFIGNSVIEFAPSGAYVEDWRQQASSGPLMGLRLVEARDEATGAVMRMEGGFVLAGDHRAYALSRAPDVDEALIRAGDLDRAIAAGIATPAQVESYEVSVAIDGPMIRYSTVPERIGRPLDLEGFSLRSDGLVVQRREVDGVSCLLLYEVDMFAPAFSFGNRTDATAEAMAWMKAEQAHLGRNAGVVR